MNRRREWLMLPIFGAVGGVLIAIYVAGPNLAMVIIGAVIGGILGFLSLFPLAMGA